MKDQIQYEKAQNKLSIIEELFIGLTEYNNLENYNNNKRFNFKITYMFDDIEKCYRYKIELIRGLNEPKTILELRLQYKEKINELLEQIISNIVKNDKFSYTSYGVDYNNLEKKFSLNMKGDVSIDFPIKDEEDRKFYEEISERYNKPTIIMSLEKESIDEQAKDELQQEKATKIIDIIKNILDSLNKYNNLENYENTKPFKLIVSNTNETDYNKFTFNIVRGDYDNETIIDLSLSIKDISIIYRELYELMLDYVCKDEFIYNTIGNSSYKKTFNIHLNNGITLTFNINTKKDELFYENFFNEYRHEIIDRKKQKLKIKES